MDRRNVEHALEWLRSGHLQPDAQMKAAAEDERDRRAKQMAACFAAHPDVLQTILQMSIFRPPVDHRLEGSAYRQHAQLRQGQDQLAAGILFYIDHAQQLERADHERRQRQSEPDAGAGTDEPGFSDRSLTDPGIAVR